MHILRLLLLTALQGLASSLQLTSVQIPAHVLLGHEAELECHYDLDGEVLYTMKWYKDGKEFYRYVPGDDPPKQAFPLPGVNVDVDRSSRNMVVLSDVAAPSEGDYRCEVSGEAPSFNTVTDGRSLEVVVLPTEGPVITGGKPQYCVGDIADLNCTSAASRPEAQLSWLVNGQPALAHHLRGTWKTAMPNGTIVVTVHMRFRVSPQHFMQGLLKVKCVATVASVYERSDGHSAEGVDDFAPRFAQPVAPEPVVDKTQTIGTSETSNNDDNSSDIVVGAQSSLILASTTFAILLLNRR